ncbi:unnamed protein product [Camellia sinensis]
MLEEKKAIVAGNGGNVAPARRRVRATKPKSYDGARGARESHAKGGRQSPQITEDEHSDIEPPRRRERHKDGQRTGSPGKRHEGKGQLECYLCNGPHMVRNCPKKALRAEKKRQLSAMERKGKKEARDSESEDPSEKMAQLGSIQLLGSISQKGGEMHIQEKDGRGAEVKAKGSTSHAQEKRDCSEAGSTMELRQILRCDLGKGKHSGSLARPNSVQRALSVLEMEVEQINKGNYEHYMQKEIHEQPESLTTTMRGRLIQEGSCKAKSVLLGGLKDHLRTIRRSRRIVFIGCGTSYNAALAARPILEELSGITVTMEVASDLLERQGSIYREDTTGFVSQSGETADTLHALEYALENGALCVGITNTVGSAIARNTHCGVHINAGAEIGVASTKAYTSKVREVLKLDQEMKDLAKLLIAEQSLLVFGRGYNYATALEGALKVKEVALMHSESILAGEMKHGPLALVDENLPIVVIATRDACFSKQQSIIQQLHARNGRLVVMCSKGDAASVSVGGSCRVIEVPQVEDCLQPVINVVPIIGLLAYHLTILRGYNVDQPHNLAKSVTTQ